MFMVLLLMNLQVFDQAPVSQSNILHQMSLCNLHFSMDQAMLRISCSFSLTEIKWYKSCENSRTSSAFGGREHEAA